MGCPRIRWGLKETKPPSTLAPPREPQSCRWPRGVEPSLPQTFAQTVSPTPGSEMGAHSRFSNPFQASGSVLGSGKVPGNPSPLPHQTPGEVGENQTPKQKMGSGWDQARAAPPCASPFSPHAAPCNQGPSTPVGPPGSLCQPPWALESASFPPHSRPGWDHRGLSAVSRLQLPSWPEGHKQESRRFS